MSAVAPLDRVTDYESVDQRFESSRAYECKEVKGRTGAALNFFPICMPHTGIENDNATSAQTSRPIPRDHFPPGVWYRPSSNSFVTPTLIDGPITFATER